MKLLENKAAIITGAATGIGAGIAEAFAGQGARVWLLDLDLAGAQAVQAAIQASGGFARAFQCDVRRPDTIAPAVEDALALHGGIDILVNNAGIYPRQSFLEMSEAQWDEIQDVNVKGVFHCTKLVLPHMARRGRGKIVNISSVVFHAGLANLTHYAASKGAVVGLTRTLAREVGPRNIHVNCITPGAVETEKEKTVSTPEQLSAILALQSLPRRIVSRDIAGACVFLASDLSDGMTGQTLNVDGGWVMH